ncbi:monosaccharide ABC transporter membrane protein, CUT2 family [Tranquillimonas rosea]|uniref:Monosaccharide ABC transporter membrane protein, CUT2 family n=2 Tax=Tranquillimonas rosea TaxID=641238 RepID=A0A1H9QFA2_9RHOB|nr:ABC transporter permease [Tranquillimonas rosea]SER59154.1 monosaccharide ABC transporter membrane protein, CUT2 family [Tranquillimonas rosea]
MVAETKSEVGEASKPKRRVQGNAVVSVLAKQGILIAFALFMLGFALFSERFLSADNVMTVLRQSAIIGVMAVGVTVVVIGGNLDLSVGSMLSFSTVMVVDLHDKLGPELAIPVMLLATLCIGAVNGTLVGFLRLNSLIVTLGMLSAIQGLTLIYSGGQNVDIANQQGTWFAIFGRGQMLGIASPIVIFLGLAVLMHIVMAYTPFGRRVYAVGGNPTAATFSGIRRSRTVFLTYVISALCVGIAAIILGSRVMGSQNNVGQGYELQVLATVILGGTSLLGGSGNVLKTVIGVLILGFIQNGLLLLGYAYYVQWIVTWIVIILAVWLDVAAKRGRLLSPIA